MFFQVKVRLFGWSSFESLQSTSVLLHVRNVSQKQERESRVLNLEIDIFSFIFAFGLGT